MGNRFILARGLIWEAFFPRSLTGCGERGKNALDFGLEPRRLCRVRASISWLARTLRRRGSLLIEHHWRGRLAQFAAFGIDRAQFQVGEVDAQLALRVALQGNRFGCEHLADERFFSHAT